MPSPEETKRNERIYELYQKGGLTQRDLAKLFDVHQKVIWRAIDRCKKRRQLGKSDKK